MREYIIQLANRIDYYVDPNYIDNLQWLLTTGDPPFIHVADILVGVNEIHLLTSEDVLVILDAAVQQQAVLAQHAFVPLEIFFDQLDDDCESSPPAGESPQSQYLFA